ncbi:MAG: hypothetical protein Q8Q73_02975, partial [Stagnimonas sp.]|nr:hypothetical protein [Stagnimonas sp.]
LLIVGGFRFGRWDVAANVGADVKKQYISALPPWTDKFDKTLFVKAIVATRFPPKLRRSS